MLSYFSVNCKRNRPPTAVGKVDSRGFFRYNIRYHGFLCLKLYLKQGAYTIISILAPGKAQHPFYSISQKEVLRYEKKIFDSRALRSDAALLAAGEISLRF